MFEKNVKMVKKFLRFFLCSSKIHTKNVWYKLEMPVQMRASMPDNYANAPSQQVKKCHNPAYQSTDQHFICAY